MNKRITDILTKRITDALPKECIWNDKTYSILSYSISTNDSRNNTVTLDLTTDTSNLKEYEVVNMSEILFSGDPDDFGLTPNHNTHKIRQVIKTKDIVGKEIFQATVDLAKHNIEVDFEFTHNDEEGKSRHSLSRILI